ncbi:MAG: hypothetical protein H8F28_24045 [Fibrella sp.]|nr:hypothetical protein [Armatimonadota bacterium]
MRRFRYPVISIFCLLAVPVLIGLSAPFAGAQTPEPAPSPAPKPAEVPDPLTDLEKAGQLTDKPEYRQSDLKPVPPLFDPKRQALFTGRSDYRKPGRLKFGVFFPQEKALRDSTEKVFISLGASVDLPPRGITRPFTPELYIDSAFHVEEDSNEASFVAGGIGFRFYPGAKAGFAATRLSSPRLFVGAGVGAYFLSYDINGVQDDEVKFGGKASIGLDFVDDWALEATYTFTGELNEVQFGGPSVLLSYRF